MLRNILILVAYPAVWSLAGLKMTETWIRVKVVPVPLLLGHLTPDDAETESGKQHQETDRHETWSDDLGLPTPVLKQQHEIRNIDLFSHEIFLRTLGIEPGTAGSERKYANHSTLLCLLPLC